MISRQSRYAKGTISFIDVKGDVLPYLSRKPPVLPPSSFLNANGVRFTYRTVIMGDRLDQYADQYFGDPTLWWIIADMNPQLSDPMFLTPGEVLRVPHA